jgi:predicted transcriptional regulator
MAKTLPPLGDLEHEFVTLIWMHGSTTAAALRKRLSRQLKDPTVRTVLRRLEEKGYVTHTVESGTFIYHAKESQQRVAASAVKSILDRFCGGSLEKMLGGMIETAMTDSHQLADIARKMKKRVTSS